MHETTAAAVRALVAALQGHPEDARLLRPYGNLPAHLADVIEDHLTEDEQ